MPRPDSNTSVVIPIDSASIAAIESCINRELLRCETMLQAAKADNGLQVALIHAENAYTIATECHLPNSQAKANFYKAQCFKALGLRHLAHDCRTKSAEELQRNVESLTRDCIAQIEAFPTPTGEDQGDVQEHRAADDDIDWIAAGEPRETAKQIHIIRDESGRIVSILSGRPSLRSMKGKDFLIPDSLPLWARQHWRLRQSSKGLRRRRTDDRDEDQEAQEGGQVTYDLEGLVSQHRQLSLFSGSRQEKRHIR